MLKGITSQVDFIRNDRRAPALNAAAEPDGLVRALPLAFQPPLHGPALALDGERSFCHFASVDSGPLTFVRVLLIHGPAGDHWL